MLLSIITVAFRNLEGIVKTHASLAHLAQAGDISFEWIVVDGGSSDGSSAFLEGLSGEHRLRFVSEPDNGIYDAMNKGIAMARGRFALFLNSGDILHANAACFIRQLKCRVTKLWSLAMRCWISAMATKLSVGQNRVGIFITACPPAIRQYFSALRTECLAL